MAELTVPQIDFSSLGQLPQIYNDARKKAVMERTLAELGNGAGPLNYDEASRKLLAAGDREGAMSLATLGMTNEQRQYQRGRDTSQDQFRREEAARAQQNADRSFGLQQSQFGLQERVANQKVDGIENQIEQRKRAAVSQGIDPASPAFQSFVLTGKMPREDQQPLTATDKKAILEADEGVMAGQAAIDALKKAKELSPKAYTGPTASARGYAASLIGSEAGEATAELENVVTSNALTQMKAIFGGNPTEGERQILLDIQGSARQPDAVRQKIFDRAIIAAERRLGFNKQRADAMRGGSFYKPQSTAAPGQQSMNLTGPGKTITGIEVTGSGITKQQYDALPSGTPYTAPDGSQRIKP